MPLPGARGTLQGFVAARRAAAEGRGRKGKGKREGGGGETAGAAEGGLGAAADVAPEVDGAVLDVGDGAEDGLAAGVGHGGLAHARVLEAPALQSAGLRANA